jgi:hypothetical protein
MGAPEGSVTWPEMVARNSCPHNGRRVEADKTRYRVFNLKLMNEFYPRIVPIGSQEW